MITANHTTAARINQITDENLIVMFKETKNKELKDVIFRTLIERPMDHEGKRKKPWDKRIKYRVSKFLKKNPLIERDSDGDTLYSKILMNLFTSMRTYNPEKVFTHYFNGLITKTLQNELRNFLTKSKQIMVDNKPICHAYQATDSLDDVLSLSDGDVDRHEVIADAYDLAGTYDRKHVLDLIMSKCDQYLDEMQFDIFMHDIVTDQLSNNDLAVKYNCCCSKISGIKNRQIAPAIEKIRVAVKRELGYEL